MKIKTNTLAVAACTTDLNTDAPNAPYASGYIESVCANYGVSIDAMITDLKEDKLFKEKLLELSIKAFNQYYNTDQGYLKADQISQAVYDVIENSVYMMTDMIIEHKIQNLRNVEYTRSETKFIDMLISKPLDNLFEKTALAIDEKITEGAYTNNQIAPLSLSATGFDKTSNISNAVWNKEWVAQLLNVHMNENTANHLKELFHPIYILRNKDRSQGQLRFVSLSVIRDFKWNDASEILEDIQDRAESNKALCATYPYLESILSALNMNWSPIEGVYDKDKDEVKIKSKPGWDFTRDIHATKIDWRYDAKDGIYNALQTVLSAPYNNNDAMNENEVWTYSVTTISDNAVMINQPVCTQILMLCLPEVVPNEMVETLEHIELYLKGNLQEYGLAVHAKFGSFTTTETVKYYASEYYSVFSCTASYGDFIDGDNFTVDINSSSNLDTETVVDMIEANVTFYMQLMFNNNIVVKCDMPHSTIEFSVSKEYNFTENEVNNSTARYTIKDLDLGDAFMKPSAIEYNVAQANTDFLTGVVTFANTNKQAEKSEENPVESK